MKHCRAMFDGMGSGGRAGWALDDDLMVKALGHDDPLVSPDGMDGVLLPDV